MVSRDITTPGGDIHTRMTPPFEVAVSTPGSSLGCQRNVRRRRCQTPVSLKQSKPWSDCPSSASKAIVNKWSTHRPSS